MVELKQTGFTKATAGRELMTYAPFAGRRPVFLGDDETVAERRAAVSIGFIVR